MRSFLNPGIFHLLIYHSLLIIHQSSLYFSPCFFFLEIDAFLSMEHDGFGDMLSRLLTSFSYMPSYLLVFSNSFHVWNGRIPYTMLLLSYSLNASYNALPSYFRFFCLLCPTSTFFSFRALYVHHLKSSSLLPVVLPLFFEPPHSIGGTGPDHLLFCPSPLSCWTRISTWQIRAASDCEDEWQRSSSSTTSGLD